MEEKRAVTEETVSSTLIAIGGSTGGTHAVTEIVTALPESVPGIVIVLHMPSVLTRSFAARLNALSDLDVREAGDGERVMRGTVLIAPGGRHLSVRRSGALYYTELTDGPPVNYVKPSVDVLFRSVARHAGRNAVGIILTGRGEDGARGLKEMRKRGAFTIAQGIAQGGESSGIFGMSGKAAALGAVTRISPPGAIVRLLVDLLSLPGEKGS
ncbi:MAG: CheB methylesterase domain-containing protein [Thermodesulfovibrionales bacterium]